MRGAGAGAARSEEEEATAEEVEAEGPKGPVAVERRDLLLETAAARQYRGEQELLRRERERQTRQPASPRAPSSSVSP